MEIQKAEVVGSKKSPKEIQRRFFDKHEDAAAFAKRKNDEGYYAKVERDGAIYGR